MHALLSSHTTIGSSTESTEYTTHETATRTGTKHTRNTGETILGAGPSPLKKLVLPEPLAPTARRAHAIPLRCVRTTPQGWFQERARSGYDGRRFAQGFAPRAPYTSHKRPAAHNGARLSQEMRECVHAPMQLCLGLKGSIATCSL